MALHAPQNGELKKFVTQFLNPAATRAEEARRLAQLAPEHDLKTSAHSIATTISALHKQAHATKPKPAAKSKTVKAAKTVDPMTAWTADARQQLKTMRAALEVFAKSLDAIETETTDRRKRLDAIRQTFVDGRL